MYNSYFGFSELPFENNLDQRFLFISEDQKEILAALSYFVKTKKAFAIVCGDVGTGKTMLINYFLGTLPEHIHPIIIANPGVSSFELLRYIARALKIEVNEKDGILELTDAVKEYLVKAKKLNKRFILITDEAHLMSDQVLEEIRLLSNIETQEEKLLQILLVGQYELSYKLDRTEMRHLRQRININRFLSPLNAVETLEYIDHRLRRVGSDFSAVFDSNCGGLIYKITGGVPRSINQLCDNALLICMGDRQRRVDRKILQKAQEALLTDRLFTPKFAKQRRARRFGKLAKFLVGAIACAAFFVLWTVLNQSGFLGSGGQQLSQKVSPTANAPDLKDVSTRQPESKGPQGLAPPAPVGSQAETTEASEAAKDSNRTAMVLAATAPGKPESTSLPDPSGPPLKAAAVNESSRASDDTLNPTSNRRLVKKGDTLSIIASRVYPGSEEQGLEAVILGNLEIRNRDLIFPDQVVFLPRVNPNNLTIKLRDNLYYSLYGRYRSSEAMKRDASLLDKEGVKYKVVETDARKGTASHRIFLGGYETERDLLTALDRVKANKK
jgi:type II secretory pathway predicted ATPase ExeA